MLGRLANAGPLRQPAVGRHPGEGDAVFQRQQLQRSHQGLQWASLRPSVAGGCSVTWPVPYLLVAGREPGGRRAGEASSGRDMAAAQGRRPSSAARSSRGRGDRPGPAPVPAPTHAAGSASARGRSRQRWPGRWWMAWRCAAGRAAGWPAPAAASGWAETSVGSGAWQASSLLLAKQHQMRHRMGSLSEDRAGGRT